MPRVENGCSYYHDCFTCPLAECRYDEDFTGKLAPGMSPDMLKAEGTEAIARSMNMLGVPVETVARTLGVTRDQAAELIAAAARRRWGYDPSE